MLNIPAPVKALFKLDSCRKNFRVHFPGGELPDVTNDNVVSVSVRFTESLSSRDVFKFGLSEASIIEFETVGVGNMYGMTIECSCEIDCTSLTAAEVEAIEAGTWDGEYVPLPGSDLGYPFFRVPYGAFKVKSCPRDHRSMAHRKVTAYSTLVPELTEFPGLPKAMLWPEVYVDVNAIIAAMTGSGLVYDRTAAGPDRIDGQPLWNSAKQQIRVYQHSQDGRYFPCIGPDSDTAFLKVTYPSDYNAAAYEACGVAVAAALTAAGYDITCGPDGKKIFETNEAALRSKMPWFFEPCVVTRMYSGSVNYLSSVQPVSNAEYVPVLKKQAYYQNLDRNKAFLLPEMQAGSPLFVAVGVWPQLEICVKVGSGNEEVLSVDTSGFLTSWPTVERYTLSAYSNIKITVKNTAAQKKTLIQQKDTGNNQYTYATKALTEYIFDGSFDTLDYLNGALELTAQFAKMGRDGAIQTVSLDDTDPVPIVPGEYESCWWDEYDVEPIGSVRYAYTNSVGEDQVVEYKFGEGASVYDMQDNAVIRAMADADQETINAMLDTLFIPNVAPVHFTPVELDALGLPYLEAGDALQITAHDGTVVNTYNLRQELSGIQALSAHVESNGGEIIEED